MRTLTYKLVTICESDGILKCGILKQDKVATFIDFNKYNEKRCIYSVKYSRKSDSHMCYATIKLQYYVDAITNHVLSCLINVMRYTSPLHFNVILILIPSADRMSAA